MFVVPDFNHAVVKLDDDGTSRPLMQAVDVTPALSGPSLTFRLRRTLLLTRSHVDSRRGVGTHCRVAFGHVIALVARQNLAPFVLKNRTGPHCGQCRRFRSGRRRSLRAGLSTPPASSSKHSFSCAKLLPAKRNKSEESGSAGTGGVVLERCPSTRGIRPVSGPGFPIRHKSRHADPRGCRKEF